MNIPIKTGLGRVGLGRKVPGSQTPGEKENLERRLNKARIIHFHRHHQLIILLSSRNIQKSHFLDLLETVLTDLRSVIEMNYPEGQLHKENKTNSPHQEEAIEQEYTRLTEKHDRDSPDLKQQSKTTEVLDKFLPKQIDLNMVIKIIEKKYKREQICL